MVGSVNKVILVGNLGRDPEVRNTQDGNKIVQLSMATSESWTDKASGERRDRTEWHRIVIFNERLAEVAEKYLRKGSKIFIEGQLVTRKWTDTSGQERYTTEIVLQKYRGELMMLDSRQESHLGMSEPFYESSYGTHQETSSSHSQDLDQESSPHRSRFSSSESKPSLRQDLDDEIPF